MPIGVMQLLTCICPYTPACTCFIPEYFQHTCINFVQRADHIWACRRKLQNATSVTNIYLPSVITHTTYHTTRLTITLVRTSKDAKLSLIEMSAFIVARLKIYCVVIKCGINSFYLNPLLNLLSAEQTTSQCTVSNTRLVQAGTGLLKVPIFTSTLCLLVVPNIRRS